jgi:hypothetical protein
MRQGAEELPALPGARLHSGNLGLGAGAARAFVIGQWPRFETFSPHEDRSAQFY